MAKDIYLILEDSNKQEEEEEGDKNEDGEQWLYEYMLGKCKEKNVGNDMVSIMELMGHYKEALDSLEKRGAVYLKKINYKTKGTLSVESNEVI